LQLAVRALPPLGGRLGDPLHELPVARQARQRLRGQDRRVPLLYELELELFFTNRRVLSIDPTDHIESLTWQPRESDDRHGLQPY